MNGFRARCRRIMSPRKKVVSAASANNYLSLERRLSVAHVGNTKPFKFARDDLWLAD